MLFSVIIINYKTQKLTGDCLDGLFALGKKNGFWPNDLEVIVIDNNSADGSAEGLQAKYGGKIKLIANQKNLGFAGANNQGAAIAQGDFLFFLNSDTIISTDILSDCLELFRQDESLGIISPRLLLPDGSYQQAAFGNFPKLKKLIFKRQQKKLEPKPDSSYLAVDWVSGCALMIKREAFAALKGWDENFFLYFEDVDLCRRAWQQQYRVAVCLSTSLVHLGGQSLAPSLAKRQVYYHSQDYYFRKHHGRTQVALLKILRLPYIIFLFCQEKIRNFSL